MKKRHFHEWHNIDDGNFITPARFFWCPPGSHGVFLALTGWCEDCGALRCRTAPTKHRRWGVKKIIRPGSYR